jgi:hypothetical protein
MQVRNLRRALVVAAAVAVCAGRASAGIASTDIVIFQQGDAANPAAATSTPLYIQELNPSLTSQTSPVQSFPISTQASPLFTSNEGSDGLLTLSNNGKLLSFTGWTSAALSPAAENTVLGRGAGTLDANGTYVQATTYTGASGNQPRSAYSPDGANYYMGDKGGLYYNGGTTPLTNSINTRSLKSFGSTVYALTASSTTTIPVVQTVSPSTPGSGPVTLTGLPGLPNDNNAVDFALLSSGNNGVGVPDTLYVTDSTAGSILKFSFNGTTWTARGSDTSLGTKIAGIMAVANGAGADLYVTNNLATGSVVEKLTDSAAFNLTISDSAATTLYTAPTGDLIRGISAAPTPEPVSLSLVALAGAGLLARRRRS